MPSQVERIASLEVEVAAMTTAVSSMEGKLDDLLALKNKGAGVFWLFSTILGGGLITVILQVVDWIKHG